MTGDLDPLEDPQGRQRKAYRWAMIALLIFNVLGWGSIAWMLWE